MVMMTRLTKASLVLTVLVTLAGCGSMSKPSSTASVVVRKPTSTSSVAARAEAACAGGPVRAPVSSDEASLSAIAMERARTSRELAALKPPAPLATGYRRLASLIAQEAYLYRRLVRDISKGNDVGALAVERMLRESPVAKQAALVGLAICA